MSDQEEHELYAAYLGSQIRTDDYQSAIVQPSPDTKDYVTRKYTHGGTINEVKSAARINPLAAFVIAFNAIYPIIKSISRLFAKPERVDPVPLVDRPHPDNALPPDALLMGEAASELLGSLRTDGIYSIDIATGESQSAKIYLDGKRITPKRPAPPPPIRAGQRM